MLDAGDPFPEFSLENQRGEIVTKSDLSGKRALVYFYPKDDTPGWTKEAQEFRAELHKNPEAVVIGVSPDSPASHAKFAKKFDLPFPLLADVRHELAEACGVWVEKMNYGRAYMGVERSSFLLDESGVVLKAWRKVKADGHASDAVGALCAIGP